MAYATPVDVAARWGRTLTDTETAQAAVLLDDAATIIDAYVTIGTGDDQQLSAAKYASCAMVIRAMSAAASDAFGVNNMSATMGPFTQQVTYANPSGDLYLSGSEKTLLHASGCVVWSMRPAIGGEDA